MEACSENITTLKRNLEVRFTSGSFHFRLLVYDALALCSEMCFSFLPRRTTAPGCSARALPQANRPRSKAVYQIWSTHLPSSRISYRSHKPAGAALVPSLARSGLNFVLVCRRACPSSTPQLSSLRSNPGSAASCPSHTTSRR